MPNVIVDRENIDILANAIASKSGEPVPMTFPEMVEAVDGITTGGIIPEGSITISRAGVTDVTNYAKAVVPEGSANGMTSDVVKTSYSTGTYNNNLTISTASVETTPIVTKGFIDPESVYSSSRRVTIRTNIPKDPTVTTSGDTVTVPAGYYSSQKSATVQSGTEGTPTATKGTVSNHSVSVTPSVTNSAGYITGGTKNGTAVTVSASELVSGSQTITENGTVDVTNLASVTVDVQGGGGSGMQVATKTATPSSASASISFTGLSGEPTSFVITSAADLATGASPYKTAAVVFDGTSLHGQIVTNTSNANASYSTAFTKSYSNGTLTVTGTESNFQANQYKLVYTYGGNSANIGTASTQVGSGATSVTFTGLTDEPDYFSVIFESDFGTSSGYQRVMAVANDGASTYGIAMDSGAKALSSWSYTYSNGSLTVSSTGTNNGGYFHQPGYYHLTYGIGGTVEPVEIEVEPLSVTQNGTYTAPAGTAYSPVTVNVAGGGASFGTVTMTNSNNQATSISFTLPSGRTPKAFFARLTSQIARNSSSRYYYVYDMRWDGSSTGGVAGNTFYMYSGTLTDVTSGYSYSQSGTTFTLSTTGSRSASPGSFYNGTYELVYVY